eukprot:TRINITY_DN1431_c0_g1_i1.p1 TRINITY_DN1431_c0_g1~~TRINITY_DN1431_c0_g1_i1.p1  ORF type:complete len:540 (+),score=95.07 TRINITY_DN1431_c0_g1_i1:110-1729(+)
MTTLFSFKPHHLLLTPTRSTKYPPLLPRTATTSGFAAHRSSFRGPVAVRFGSNTSFSDFESAAGGLVGEAFGRAEGLLYTIADAAAALSSDSASGATRNSDWLSGITNYMESVLKVLKDGLSAFHVPYAYGFAIILLTVLVKAATFPLTKKQVESALTMRSLQPQIKAIQQRYAGDQERIQLETARLYKLAGVNPFAGCLPTLVTVPVWIGLYRALSNVADEGLLTEGFFWIPSLSGPTTIAARQSGTGISWFFPFVDGHPPLGWSNTLAYLVLPVLLVVTQYISVQIMQSSQGNDPSEKGSQVLTKVLPLMIGYFALSVPSGLSLYWFTNNILSTTQQIWLQKMGGAKIPVRQYEDETIGIEKNNIRKSAVEIDSKKLESKQEEKSSSGKLHPGERFKQIKEQEERRRQQREEEKRKAEEAANGANIINENKQETVSVKIENERLQSTTVIHDSSGVTMENGRHTSQDSIKDQTNLLMPKMKNGRLNCNNSVVVKDEQDSYESLEKEAVEVYTTVSNNESTKPADLDRREQSTGSDEA